MRFQIGDYWLSKRDGSDNWYRTWTEGRVTRRASLGTSDFEEAKVRLAEWYLANAKLSNERPEDVSVTVLLDRYHRAHGAKVASRSTQGAAVKRFSEFYADDTVASLTKARQLEAIEWMRDEGLEDGTIKRYITVLKSALHRAHDLEEIARIPKLYSVPNGPAYDFVATQEQIAAFIHAITEPHLFDYVIIRLTTMCRHDAAVDLGHEQCDFRHRLINLNPRGRRQTKKRRPVVPMTDAFYRLFHGRTDAPFVQYAGKRITSVKKAWKATALRAGLPAQFIPKTLRHTMATELRRRKVDGWDVSGMLGHTGGNSGSTTEVYAKYDPRHLQDARRAIDEYVEELAGIVERI